VANSCSVMDQRRARNAAWASTEVLPVMCCPRKEQGDTSTTLPIAWMISVDDGLTPFTARLRFLRHPHGWAQRSGDTNPIFDGLRKRWDRSRGRNVLGPDQLIGG
jgi:hypothetical protein